MKLNRLAVLALCCSPLAAVAQTDQAPEEAPQMKPQPVPTELSQLDWMIGTWRADMRWEASEKGPAGSARGTEIVTEGPGGQSHLSDFEADMQGQPYEGHGVFSYDPQKREYVSVWTDSFMPGVMVMRGAMLEGRIVLEGLMTGPDGKPVEHRSTLRRITDDAYSMTMERRKAGVWTTSFTIDYTRQQ